MGIAITPRYKTVTKGTGVGFIISGRGDKSADYRVVFKAEGITKTDEWFRGPDTFEYSASHRFDTAGKIPTIATITEYPTMVKEEQAGEITVEEVGLEEFKFAIRSLTDMRVIFIAGTPWPGLVRKIKAGEDVYVHYAVINIGAEAGKGIITVKDLNTGKTITTWSIPEVEPNYRFKTTGSGAYVGKMPSKDWRLEFKVVP